MPTHDCVHDQVARRDADALALVSGQRRVSYGELDRWANRIAHTLRALGIGRDQVVAVSAEPSPELVAGHLGVLRAGAAGLPVAPDTPADRVAALLDAVGVEVVLAPWVQAARLPATVRLLELDDGFDDAPSHDPLSGAVPDDLAFVVDRPEQDGAPLPLMIPHVAVPDAAALAAAGSYAASVLRLWPDLMDGATVHLDRLPDDPVEFGPDTETHLLDGEPYIAGPSVARGVFGRPALTATLLRPNPFSATPGARLQHTGAMTSPGPDGQLEPNGSGAGEPARAPQGRLVAVVARVWADVLGCGEQGHSALLAGTADFFQLGGQSMLAIAAALQLSDELEVSVAPRLVFEVPTVPAFAARLEPLLDAPPPTKITPLPRD